MWHRRNIIGVTIAVIAVFGPSLASPVHNKGGMGKRIAAKVQINTFEGALGQFKEDTGSFPTQDQGLAALRSNPKIKGWKGPYLSQDVPNDPWNRPYIYQYPSQHGDEPDIISLGEDGQPGGEGSAIDIASWRSN